MESAFQLKFNGENYFLEVESMGHGFLQKPCSYVHLHPAYHLILVSYGQNRVMLRGANPVEVGKNTLFLINPMVPHSFVPDEKTGVEHTCIIWRFRDEHGNYAEFPLQSLFGDADTSPLLMRTLSDNEAQLFIRKGKEMLRIMEYRDLPECAVTNEVKFGHFSFNQRTIESKYHRKMTGKRNDSILHLSGINLNIVLWEWWLCGLRLMLPEHFEPVSIKDLPAHERILRQIKHFVKAELKKPGLNVLRIAEYTGMHPNYINSVFKLETGMTIGRYIKERRLEMATAFLRNTNKPLSEIASTCGFAQQAYFTRVFKQEFGLTPFAFRNRNTND